MPELIIGNTMCLLTAFILSHERTPRTFLILYSPAYYSNTIYYRYNPGLFSFVARSPTAWVLFTKGGPKGLLLCCSLAYCLNTFDERPAPTLFSFIA